MRISRVTLLGAALAVAVVMRAQSVPYWQQRGYQRGPGDEAHALAVLERELRIARHDGGSTLLTSRS